MALAIATALLACLVIVLFACSLEAPSAGSSMADAHVGEEPASAPHTAASPTVGSPSLPTVAPAQQPPRLRNQQRPPPGRSLRRPRLMRFPQSCWLWRRPKYQSSCRSTAATTGATGLTRDGDCQNARNEVLLAERLAAIAYSPDRRCRAASGKWLVPYSGTVVTVLGELDIDPWFPRSTPAVEGSSNGRRSEGGSMPTTSTIPILSSL